MKKNFRFQFDVPQASSVNRPFAATRTEVAKARTAEDLVGLFVSPQTRMLRQDPPMSLRDEIIFLLHTAAEIEHALMTQYLYAAYSCLPTDPHNSWRETLLGIAREEMGHLVSVQNCLLAIGGPLNFEREDYPFNELYPFPLRLEPLSVHSLAKYVLAEMPDPSNVPGSLKLNLDQLKTDAGVVAGENEIDRVGALFNLLLELVTQLMTDDVDVKSETFQTSPQKWNAHAYNMIVDRVTAIEQLAKLLGAIGEQGEGPTEPSSGPPSHFLRLFALYSAVREYQITNGSSSIAYSVPTDPTVRDSSAQGYIDHPKGRVWAIIFNERYRRVLAMLAHQLQMASGKFKDQLTRWALADMNWLKRISENLTKLPQNDPPKFTADGRPRRGGPPFELPHSLQLPVRQVDIWRHHLMLARHSLKLLDLLQTQDALANSLRAEDTNRIKQIQKRLEDQQ